MRDHLASNRSLDRFGVLLALVVTAVVTSSLVDLSSTLAGSLAVHALNGAALVVAVRAAGVRPRLVRLADVLVAVTLAIYVLSLLVDLLTPADVSPAVGGGYLWVFASVAVPVVVARRVASHREVTLQTVMGALAAYLQIAVAYATLYRALDAAAGPIFGERVDTTVYTYFSLTTITTLGYGDVAATTAAARTLATTEAVLGQVYLVVFVALIVARFAGGPSRPSSGSTEP